MADQKTVVLTHPNEAGQKQDHKMDIAKAEKMLNCRTTSKKWGFKDDKIKFVKTKDEKTGKSIGKIVFP